MKRSFIERYENKPIYKDKEYIPALLLFLFILSLIGYTLYVDGNSINLKSSTSFVGKIEKTFNQKGIYYIKLTNEENWFKLKNIRNKKYSELEYDFMTIIGKRDSILKKKNSDTIILIRKKEKYYFKIENYIQ